MPVDTETKKYLEEVKKGKPRRFVMICKGVKILSMIVYKKGAVEKYKKQAKEQGKGQFYHGVVDGKGVNISFKLLRGDGYEAPPGKELILKDFLKTEADMKFKPVYEIVDVLPEVAEEGDDLETGDADMTATMSTEVDTLQAQFKQLEPGIKDFVRVWPDRRVEILKPTKVVKDFLSASATGDISAAQLALTTIQQLVDALPKSAEPVEASVSSDDDPEAIFTARFKDLLPQIKQSAGTQAGDEAKLKASQAGVLARKKDFAAAIELLDGAETLIKQGRAVAPASVAEGGDVAADDPRQAEFAARFKELLPVAVPLAKAGGERGQALLPLLKTVQAQRTAGDVIGGLETLLQIDQLLKEPSAANPLARWQAARADVITKLKEIAKEVAEEQHPHSVAAIIELKAVIANLTAEPESERQVDELERYLVQDDVVADVCDMAYDIRSPLLEALAEIKPQLAN